MSVGTANQPMRVWSAPVAGSANALHRYGYGAALSMVIFFILLTFCIFFLKRTRATESVYT